MPYTKADFERELQSAIENNTVTGAALLAVDRSGRTLMEKCFGKSDVGGDEAPDFTLDTTFWMASSTKLVTSVSALQLVERGLVSLDEPVGEVLHELASPDIMTGVDAETGKITMKKATKRITLRHLLTHSSGLAYDNGFSALPVQYREEHGLGPALNNKPLPDAHVRALIFEPGESWEYGLGIDWAGLLVERISGKSLGQYFEDHIFSPLGIKRMVFDGLPYPDIMKTLHGMVMRGPDGKMTRMEGDLFKPVIDAYNAGGAGLYGCSREFIKILKSLLTGDEKLLKRSTVESLKTGCLSKKSKARLNELVRDRFWGPGIAVGMPRSDPSVVFDYSLVGGVVATKVEDEFEAGMLHWGGLPNNNWYIDLNRGVAGYWGTFLLPVGDKVTGDLWGRFRKAMYHEVGAVNSPSSKL